MWRRSKHIVYAHTTSEQASERQASERTVLNSARAVHTLMLHTSRANSTHSSSSCHRLMFCTVRCVCECVNFAFLLLVELLLPLFPSLLLLFLDVVQQLLAGTSCDFSLCV